MKRAIAYWLGLVGMVSAGALTFPDSLKEVNPKADETKLTIDYPFKNETDKTVVIREAQGDCSCTSVQISQGKKTYAPGESGTIRVNFDMGNFWGKVDKVTTIWLEDDPKDTPSQKLTLRVNIPVLIEIEPKTLKWDIGEKPEPKTIRLTMKGDKPIQVLSVSPSTENFDHELKTIEAGKSYEIVMTPKNIEKSALSVFRITTDCEIERHSVQQVFGVVKRGSASAAAPK